MAAPVNSFRFLARDIAERFNQPRLSFTFWYFLVFGIGLFGGCAVWIELYKYISTVHSSLDGVRLAILTYFPAIGCAAGQQLAIYEEKRPYVRHFGWTATLVLLLLCAIGFGFQESHPTLVLVLGILSSIIAIFVAWIAIGLDKPWIETDPGAAVGGNPDVPLSGGTGGYSL